MTIDMTIVTAFGSVVALLIGLKSLGILKPWLTKYAKAEELDKLAGRIEDVSIEIKEINGKFEKWDSKIDKIIEATQDIKLDCARNRCKGE
jgi:hypothetical protein